jgi:Flp pilus assembly protein TadD
MGTDKPVQGTRRGHLITLVIGALLVAVVIYGIVVVNHRHSKANEPNPEASNEYVAPQICGTCHADIAATYGQTGMGRSFHKAGSRPLEADFKSKNTLIHSLSGKTYKMVERDKVYFEERQTVGFGGQSEDYERQIDYVIGSGNHARTFLHRTPEGRLIELPVSWYAENGGHWGMSPGYDQAGQMDFRRAIGKECMFCHNGYPESDPSPSNLTDGAIFAAKLPEGIDCQRCHGPGAEHVRLVQSGGDVAAIKAAIVNPARLSRERQLDSCRQCHLETTSLPLPNSIRKYTRAAYSFRPGEPLTDYTVYFDHKPGTGYDDRLEVAHQAYRLEKSQCFLKSEMTCTTCHNPHNVPRGEEAVKHYVAVCEGCHTGAHPKVKGEPAVSAQSDCLTCHMWKRRTDDVVHVVMTDHYIQRFKPKPDPLAPIEEKIPVYHDEVVAYYPKSLSGVPVGDLYYDVAQVTAGSITKENVARLQHDLETQKPAQAGFYFALAIAYTTLGDDATAAGWFEKALEYPDHVPGTQRELSASLARSGQLSRAVQVAEQAVAAEPNDTEGLTDIGNIYLQMGRVPDAQRTLTHALGIDPDLSPASNLLGLVQMKLNNPSEAEKMFRRAVLIDPGGAEAQSNLATLLADQGKVQEAKFRIGAAMKADPDSAEVHRKFALILAANRSFEQAADQMREAIRLSPKRAELYTTLGDLLGAAGHFDAAQQEYVNAIQIDAAQAKAHVGLASILMAQNKPAQAEQEYRLAAAADPRDSEVHLALAELALRNGQEAEARHELELAADGDESPAREEARRLLRR